MVKRSMKVLVVGNEVEGYDIKVVIVITFSSSYALTAYLLLTLVSISNNTLYIIKEKKGMRVRSRS